MSQSWLGDLYIEEEYNTNINLEDTHEDRNYLGIIIAASLITGLACMKIGYYVRKCMFDKVKKEVKKEDKNIV